MRKRWLAFILFAFTALDAAALAAARQRRLPKPGWNMFSKQQDIELGQEYAKQVERQYTVINNGELTAYINRIGKRLVEKGGLDSSYPYSFKVVHDDSINAFALPGGPMYVHTGLIKAAENEAQLAGVLAHELSHVVLRHGTNQASKAQFAQIGAMIGGALLGSGSLTGQLAQLGIGLGANSVLLKFSRGAESDADLLGAYTMARAGYNPVEMARFFEKLEAEAGGKSSKLVEIFTASHPNPGNRVKAIEDQLPYMPRSDYNTVEGNLKAMQAIVAKLGPAPKPRPQTAAGQGTATSPNAPKPASVPVSSRLKQYQGGGFSISYPDNWQANAGQNSVTIAPPEGLVQGSVGYGIIVSTAQPPSGRVSLDSDTRQLLQSMAQQNPGMQVVEPSQRITLNGSAALVTKLKSQSPFANNSEIDVVITVDRGNSLFSLICVAPESDYPRFEPLYQQMVRSVRFP